MSIIKQLQDLASQTATKLQAKADELERQLAEIEKQKMEIEAKRKDARLAPQRLANYPVKLGGDYLCPVCWLESGTRSPIQPVSSETSDDNFRCKLCHSDFSFSA